MKLSFTSVSIGKDLTFEQCLALAKDSGCAGLEFRTGNVFPHGIEVSLSKEERKTRRRQVEDQYLEVACLNSQYELHNPEAAERRKIVDGVAATAELAADLGCRMVRVFGNNVPAGVNAQDCVAYVAETLGQMADKAAPLGVTILLEMHGQFNYWGYTLPAVQAAGRANAAVLYNCDNRDLVSGNARETFLRVKPYVKHIHMHDVGREYPYLQLFEELVRMDYQGYLSAEIDGSSDPTRVMKLHNTAVRALIDLARLRVGVGLIG